MTGLSYAPAPHEQAYYEGLFAAADVRRSGNINGGEAVAFFSRSQLPQETLKNIWTVSDQPVTHALDRRKFAIAVRLIQLSQNGQRGEGANLAAPAGVTLRPVMFEGVSGVAVPLPPEGGAAPPPHPQQQTMRPPQPQRAPQQQQPPSSQQMGMPPPSPTRPSNALTAQDPYSMPPQDLARYEGIFPQYQKDGFVHGKEAVGLFSKSGLSQDTLRTIWNMVDSPVDNKLDQMEFAIAMHLIVCISKKNLPVPPNGLPLALKQLKRQGSAPPSMGMPPPTEDASVASGPPPLQHPPVSPQPAMRQTMQQAPQPAMQTMQQAPQPAMQQTMQQAPQPAMQQTMQQALPPSGLQGPPPITHAGGGGMSISDAFEGLDSVGGTVDNSASFAGIGLPEPTGVGGGGSLPVSSTLGTQPHPSFDAGSSIPEPAAVNDVSSFSMNMEPAPAPAPAPTPTPAPAPVMQQPKTTKDLAASYDMGTASGELEKLKGVLQKLQAENISLKAQLGSMTDEEKEVLKEIGAATAEISKLSNELTTLRAQVLAAKSRLLDATAELKAVNEKKGVMQDLIGEARSTKEAIDEAYAGIENANEASHAAAAAKAHQANAAAESFTADLFSFDAPAPPTNYNEPPAASAAAGPSVPVPSFDTTTASEQSRPDLQQQQQFGGFPYQQQSAPQAAPQYEHAAAEPLPQPELPAPPQHHQEPTFQPSLGSDLTPANHQRRGSEGGFNSEGMGGFPQGGGLSFQSQEHNAAPSVPQGHPGATTDAAAASAATIGPSMEEIEELKRKAQQAEEISRDAEETRRRLFAETDELRRLADEAEASAREVQSQAQEKKGGLFGRGKVKGAKEAEKARHDAEAKRKKFLAVQGQANDAQSVAIETNREAEKLRKAVEQAELDAAAAASMRDAPPTANGYPSAAPPGTSSGAPFGGGAPRGGGAPLGGQPKQYGTPAPTLNSGFGSAGTGYGGGFAAGVMGAGAGADSGGFSIPSPEDLKTGDSDPYENPF